MLGTKLRVTRAAALALAMSSGSLLGACAPTDEAPVDGDDRDDNDDESSSKRKGDAGSSSSRSDAKAPASRGEDEGDEAKSDEDEGADEKPVDKGDTENPDGGSGNDSALWCKVKPVLEARCTSCHDGKGTAGTPSGLDFANHADLLKDSPDEDGEKMFERVGVRINPDSSGLPPMPPGKPLTDEQKADIAAWIEAGAPDAEDCAAAPPPEGGIGPDGRPISVWDESICDDIYKITVPALKVPPSPEETYTQVDIDAPWGDEKVQVINQRPITDNGPVLHHWILYDKAGPFLTGWAPGDEERRPLPKDVGMQMPSGRASMYLDMHYYNKTGKMQVDSSGVELCVVKGENLRPNPAGITMGFSQLSINIPPGATEHSVKGTCTVRASAPINIMTASPHAHRLAKRTVFKVQKKDGTIIEMLDEKFTFGEQATFPLDEHVVVENGDKILTECVYFNDTASPVRFGESNDSEMCFNFASYYPIGGFCCEELGLQSCLLGGGGPTSGGLSGLDPSSIFGGG